MFTGIIEAIGKICMLEHQLQGARVAVEAPHSWDSLQAGDSIAVNGVCLTVRTLHDREITFDVSRETAMTTTLGRARVGARVNLERALLPTTRMGGHFVQGHVDAVGRIISLESSGSGWRMCVSFPPALAPYIVRKGSIAVDGISLTVAGMDEARFWIAVVPFTWENTNLHTLTENDLVNLETDILGKYVVQSLGKNSIRAFSTPMTIEYLKEQGF